jgi:hypothetical protein
MRRISMATPLVVVAVLMAASGCSSKSAQAGSGGLNNAPTFATTAAPSTTAPTNTTGATPTAKATTKKPTSTSDWPSPSDCVSYNPANLSLDGSGSTGTFLVTDGSTVVMRLHGQDDQVGQQALALAQRYRKHCYIGRNNHRDATGDFIFDYWRDPTGTSTTIPGEDDACSPYNNHNLTVEDMGEGQGWRVKDHDHVLHVFDNGSDARNGNTVLLKYTQICSIGEVLDSDKDLGAVTYEK